MVGLSDIPCVGIAVDKISEATVEAGIRGLRYMLCSKNLVSDLNSEIGKVEIQEEGVARKVDEARADGKIIENHVVVWQENVENIKTRANELSRQTITCTCFKVVDFPNPVSRFRLGRKAAHLAKIVTEHTDSGKEILGSEIAHRPPYDNVPNSDTSYLSFRSRQEAYGKLWDALVNEDGYPILGIYGMPGVGKTLMMEQAWKKSKDKKIFDKVTRANVSGEKFDVIKLQGQLADDLNCHLKSKDNEMQRASQLKNSLMNGGKTLVILDDVWDVIPLIKIGIPFGDGSSKGCKILLTSRKQDVCLRNNCKDPIEIKTLTDTEAWEMFKSSAGTSKIESLKDELAEKVCKECAALPLLIDAVAKALKFATENSWKDALYQLENSRFEEIDGIEPQVYVCLRLSFEKLTNAAKTCLLLCSYFPEDADIDIKMLFDMATGSELLDSRRNIGGVVDNLKSSSLLLQGKDSDTVKLHDVIRDVARSIASSDPKYAFLSIRCRLRVPDDAGYPSRRLLHLDLEGENVRFPGDLVWPNLHTLWLKCNNHSQQLSNGFFSAFKNVKVLLLQGTSFSEKQWSIHNLEKLRVLILDGCVISQEILNSVSGSLETLCIWNCNLPSPLHIPELKDLRKLELLNPDQIEMVGNSISSLSSLQELNIPSGFKVSNNADTISIYAELSQLSCLRNLVIYLDYPHSYPDKDIFSSLPEFNIYLGPSLYSLSEWDSKARCAIRLADNNIESVWMALVERAEKVKLEMVKDLQNGFSDINMGEAFANLRDLAIISCNDMEHVADWDGRNRLLSSSFSKLTILNIEKCSELKYLFSSCVAKCLLQIEQLTVVDCSAIEEIISVDGGTDHGEEFISFPKLEVLHLEDLPSLKSFYNNKKVTFPKMVSFTMTNLNTTLREEIELGRDDDSPSTLTTLKVSCTDSQLQLLPSQWKLQLQNLEILDLKNCWWPGHSLFNGALTLERLQMLEVDNCESSTLVSSSAFRSFQQLVYLQVSNCSLLKEIVEEEEHGINEKTHISLLELMTVMLLDLPNLQSSGISTCYMPALAIVVIYNCGFSSLFTMSAFRSLKQLRRLSVLDCPWLEQIVEDETDDQTPGTTDKISSLHLLKIIKLVRLPNIKSFSSSSTFCFNMPALEDVTLKDCPDMEKFTSLQISTPLLKEDLNSYVRRQVYEGDITSVVGE